MNNLKQVSTEDLKKRKEELEELLIASGRILCSCIKCGYKKLAPKGKHCTSLTCPKCGGEMRRAERPGPGKELDEIELELESDKKDEGIELDANEIKNIIKDVIKENVKDFKNEITKGIDDNFKRATGKVL